MIFHLTSRKVIGSSDTNICLRYIVSRMVRAYLSFGYKIPKESRRCPNGSDAIQARCNAVIWQQPVIITNPFQTIKRRKFLVVIKRFVWSFNCVMRYVFVFASLNCMIICFLFDRIPYACVGCPVFEGLDCSIDWFDCLIWDLHSWVAIQRSMSGLPRTNVEY